MLGGLWGHDYRSDILLIYIKQLIKYRGGGGEDGPLELRQRGRFALRVRLPMFRWNPLRQSGQH